jgi:hypothetical protein
MNWITGKEHQAIAKIYRYLIHEERKHWEESNKPKKHIYMALRELTWLATGRRNKKGK